MADTFCEYYDRGSCRSCAWLERPYADQLEAKQARVREALAFADLDPGAGSRERGFRHRAKLAVTGTRERPVVGLPGAIGEAPLDEGRELLACPIHHPALNALLAALPGFITRFDLTPYRIAARDGELKGVIAFHSPGTGQSYLRFVLRSRECVSRLRKALPELQARFPGLVCVTANIQSVPHATLEGPEEIYLTERRWIDHEVGGRRVPLSPRAFVQTHSEIAAELYATAARWVAESGAARLLELFCGQGLFSLAAAGSVERALGIEINADAVDAAARAAREAGLGNLEFRCLDAARVEPELRAFAPDLVLVNPPRRGLGDALPAVERSGARHLIYSSCALGTLASDLGRLAPAGYRVRRARVLDMFPHTEHFETLVWLERG